ncbi:MAG: metallophosphoesterase, partial [Thermoanaerobaculia bacterium]
MSRLGKALLVAVAATGLLAGAAALAGPGTTARIVAVGDVHGASDGLLAILRAANLVDTTGRWTGGDSVLVQTGDILDRGDEVAPVVDLLQRLQNEAPAEGGRVVVLLGNHEEMNLLFDFRDVSAGTFAAFADAES